MNWNGYILFVFIFYVISGIAYNFICVNLAERKGYYNTNYGILGFLFGIIVLIYVAGLPDRKIGEEIYEIKKMLINSNNSPMDNAPQNVYPSEQNVLTEVELDRGAEINTIRAQKENSKPRRY